MSMIACPECKKKISETAINCPKCGYQLTPEKMDEIKKKEQQVPKGCAIGCLSVIVIFVVLYIIGSFSSDSPKGNVEKANKQEATLLPKTDFTEPNKIAPKLKKNAPKYTIISEKRNLRLRKNNLKIRLYKRVDEKTLKKIAMSLRYFRRGYDRLWIFYYIPDQNIDTASWAISHFTPKLDLEILGASGEEIKSLKNVYVQHKIIGRWLVLLHRTECSIIVYEKAKKYFMKMTFKDGSFLDQEITIKQENGKVRYGVIGEHNGEYFLIEKNKNLGMYGKNGKWDEAKKAD